VKKTGWGINPVGDGVRRVSHATVVDGKNPLPLGHGEYVKA